MYLVERSPRFICFALCLFLWACGGGSVPGQSRAVDVSMAIEGASATNVRSIDFYLDLPVGVVIHTDADGAVSGADFSVATSGGGSGTSYVTRYLPASGTGPAKLHVIVLSTAGFTGAPFATLCYYVPPNSGATTFTVENVTASDADGVSVSGIGVACS